MSCWLHILLCLFFYLTEEYFSYWLYFNCIKWNRYNFYCWLYWSCICIVGYPVFVSVGMYFDYWLWCTVSYLIFVLLAILHLYGWLSCICIKWNGWLSNWLQNAAHRPWNERHLALDPLFHCKTPFIVLHCIAIHWIYYIVLYYIAKHCIVLHYVALVYTVFCSFAVVHSIALLSPLDDTLHRTLPYIELQVNAQRTVRPAWTWLTR